MQYHHQYPKMTVPFKMFEFSARSVSTGSLGLAHRGVKGKWQRKREISIFSSSPWLDCFVSVMKLDLKIFFYLDVHSEKENF